MRGRAACLVMVALGLLLWPAGAGRAQTQDPAEAQLTVTLLRPRLDEASPYDAERFLPQILDHATDEISLQFWGAGALAYPNIVQHPVWSPDGERLALHFADQDGRESLVMLDTNTRQLTEWLPYGSQLSDISPAQWMPDNEYIVFGATQNGEAALWRFARSDRSLDRLAAGRWPLAEGDNLLFISPDGSLLRYDMASRQTETLLALEDLSEATAMALSPDGLRLAVAIGGEIVFINFNNMAEMRRFSPDADALLGEQPRIPSLVWDADGNGVYAIVNTPPTRSEILYIDAFSDDDALVIRQALYPMQAATLFTGLDIAGRGAFIPSRDARTDF